MTLNTTFLLMAQYNGKAIVPLADVCRDYFSHLAAEKLFRKVMAGQIPLTCSPLLDRPEPELPGCLAQVAEAADEPFMSEIGGLLPIALWGRTVL